MYREDMTFIGIIESNENRKTITTIKSILMEFDYKLIYTNEFKNILCLKNEDKILIIIDINLKDVEFYDKLGIEFDILVHNFIKREEYNNKLLGRQFKNCKYYILNSDDPDWNLLRVNLLEGVVINYGYNRKSTLTISSHSIEGSINMNIYLQRELETLSKAKIDPFEFTLEVDSENKNDIYPVLAASALNLILVNKNSSIKAYKNIKI